MKVEKKDKLQVSYEMFRDSLKMYQCTVKKAKEQYYSDLISSNAHRPKVLFNTINSILIPASTSSTFTPSNETCEQFPAFFNNKVEQIRASFPLCQTPQTLMPPPPTFNISNQYHAHN